MAGWAKLYTDWHRDERLAPIADEHGPRALAYWAVLIAESKRFLATRSGWVTTTINEFAGLVYDDRSRRKQRLALWDALSDAKLVEIDGALLGRFLVRPTKIESIHGHTPSTLRLHPDDSPATLRAQSEHTPTTNGLHEMQGKEQRTLADTTRLKSKTENREEQTTPTAPSEPAAALSSSGPTPRTEELPSGITPQDLARAEIQKLRGRLGVLAIDGDSVAAKWRDDHPNMTPGSELREVWAVLAVVCREFERSVASSAMAAYAASPKRIGHLGPWMRSTAAGIARDQQHAENTGRPLPGTAPPLRHEPTMDELEAERLKLVGGPGAA